MFTVYILYSPKIDRYYIGQTEDFESRFELHLNKTFKGSFTSQANDWELFFKMACNSRMQSLLIEKHIKRMKSRKYFEDLKRYPEIKERLLDKYR